MKIAKFLRTSFFIEHLRWLRLHILVPHIYFLPMSNGNNKDNNINKSSNNDDDRNNNNNNNNIDNNKESLN